jgi:two-component system, OmpR family, phosphate regulon response regulator PhoB
MPRVLIVEDDPDISTVLDFNFQREGFHTQVAHTGASALRAMRDVPADLIVLDLMLPDIAGLDVCREVRAEPHTKDVPILIVTAKGQEADRLLGLETGADDYVTKPFNVRELILRASALMRRSTSTNSAATRIESGAIVVDSGAHRVFVEGKETHLTNTEYRLLLIFLNRPGRVFSRRQLLNQVWNMRGQLVTRTVDTHVKRLREKLGNAGAAIETVRAVGYRYASPA